MATLSPFKQRNCWRVAYTITLPDEKKRKTKYARTKAEATTLSGQLAQVESATRTGIAAQRDIEEWLRRKWLSDEDARQAFFGYTESADRAQQAGTRSADYAAILQAYEKYLEDNSSPGINGRNHRTAMGRAAQVVRWLEEKAPVLPDLKVEHVQTYRAHLRGQGYSPWTIFHYMTALRILVDRAIDMGMARENPARKVRLRQPKKLAERRVLTQEEAVWLLEVSLRHRRWIHGGLPTLTRLGLYAGLRNQEMTWLQWDSVDWDRRVITIQESVCQLTGQVWTPKDHELRRLDVKPACLDYLREEKARQEKAGIVGPFVLPGGGSRRPSFRLKPLSQDAAQKALLKLLAAEGKQDSGITLYSLRHAYATMALRSGVDLRTLQTRMGHSDIKVTMEYLHYIEPEEHPMDRLPY